MKVLIICREKPAFEHRMMPFVYEQAYALKEQGIETDFFLVSGLMPFAYFNHKRLNEKIRSFHPDIIHAHYGLSAIPALLSKKVPVVVTFHNGETLNWHINLLTSLFSLKADHVIYVAQHIRDLCYFKAKNYSILPCGVNLDEIEIIPYRQARRLLEFEDDKKYILFGGAFSNLRKNYPLLKEAIEKSGRDDIEVLEMKGLSRAECTLRMCACDLFALPTKSEGSPQALKEAMACNCPIIATDVADIRHLLGELDGHYICSFNPDEVANVLNCALSFNGRTEGRQRIIRLGLTNNQVAKQLIEIYKDLTNCCKITEQVSAK